MRRLRRVSPFLEETLESVTPQEMAMHRRHMEIRSSILDSKEGDVFIRRDGEETVFDGFITDDCLAIQFHNKRTNAMCFYDIWGVPESGIDDDMRTLMRKKDE